MPSAAVLIGALKVNYNIVFVFFSVATATVDTDSDTVVCGGVKLHGLNTSISARQISASVITEAAVFLPYYDVQPEATLVDRSMGASSVAEKRVLEQYASECSVVAYKVIHKITDSKAAYGDFIPNKRFLEELSRGEAVKDTGELNIEQYLSDSHYGIMQCLDKIDSLPESQNFLDNLKNIIEALEEDIKNDILMTSVLNSNILKSCLDIVYENCKTDYLKILSLSRRRLSDFHDRLALLLENSPMINAEITAASEDDDNHLLAKVISNQSILSEETEPYHFILADGILSESENLQSVLSNLADAVVDGGFVLLKEMTHSLSVPYLIQRFFKDISRIKDSQNRDFGSFLKKESWKDLIQGNVNFTLVSSFSDSVLSSLFLLRKITPSPHPEQQTVVHIDHCEFSWLPLLQNEWASSQKKTKGQNLWLVTNGEPNSGIVGMVKCLVKEPAGRHVRYLYNLISNRFT